jgi:hypothetical protein
MITFVTIGMIAFGMLLAFSNWRWGLYIIIVTAAFQDPLRKLMPGTPGWMALASAPIFLSAALACRLARADWWSQFNLRFSRISKNLLLFGVLMLPAIGLSVTYGPGSWQFTLLGLFSYSIIFIAMITGFHFARDLDAIKRLLSLYCVLHGIMLSGTVFQYLGMFPDWAILGDDALGYQWLRWVPGYILRLYSGFYRSADVMGWHAASVCILSLVLTFSTRGPKRWFWIVLSGWAILALFLCGRRKMVYMIPVFAVALGWIYFQVGRSSRIVPLVGFLLLTAASVYFVSDFLGEESGQMHYYETAGESDGVYDRLVGHGFISIAETYRQSGFFGEGLGFATPGAHHFPGSHPRIWQESAPSRIMVELGVPGFIGFILLMASIVAGVWRSARAHLLTRTPVGYMAAGIMAFFIANVGSLTVSGQILSDSFIAVFLGFLVGVVLGFSRPPFVPSPIPSTASDLRPVARMQSVGNV